MRRGLFIITGMLLVTSLTSGCTPSRNFNSSLKTIVQPYNFSIVKWESKAIFEEVKQLIAGNSTAGGNSVSEVVGYFSAGEEVRNKKAAIDAVNSGSQKGDLALLEVELEGNEESILVAEDSGILAILVRSSVPGKGLRITNAHLYDLQTKEISDLELKQFSNPASYSRIGVPFLILG